MHKTLKKQYMIIILPVLGLFLAFGLARSLDILKPGLFVIPSVLHGALFVLSAITAIAGPLFLRTLFAHSMREQKHVPAKEFLSFQRKILWISQITPYFAFTAVLCDFPRFYAGAIVLMALYAVYYYFPSQKRINFDRKIFRVK
ncbi:MAG: hypothetical protein KAQ72_08130 [Desulfobacula sp.]|nr:hypothetical protein [Desulfobacula sp.]